MDEMNNVRIIESQIRLIWELEALGFVNLAQHIARTLYFMLKRDELRLQSIHKLPETTINGLSQIKKSIFKQKITFPAIIKHIRSQFLLCRKPFSKSFSPGTYSIVSERYILSRRVFYCLGKVYFVSESILLSRNDIFLSRSVLFSLGIIYVCLGAYFIVSDRYIFVSQHVFLSRIINYLSRER